MSASFDSKLVITLGTDKLQVINESKKVRYGETM